MTIIDTKADMVVSITTSQNSPLRCLHSSTQQGFLYDDTHGHGSGGQRGMVVCFSNFQIEYCKHPFDCSKNRLYGVYLNFS
jgi:hypothetical protein